MVSKKSKFWIRALCALSVCFFQFACGSSSSKKTTDLVSNPELHVVLGQVLGKSLTDPGLERLRPGTNLARNSDLALSIRLQTLFPGANASNSGLLPPEQLDDLRAAGFNRALAREERPVTAVAQSAFRQMVEPACNWAGDQSPSSAPYLEHGGVFSASDVLMDGEVLPDATKEPAKYWAFIIARNTFLYPYAADSTEVKALADLFTEQYLEKKSIKQSEQISISSAKKITCLAALMSPQFLIGNPGKIDVVRRVALELAARRPTFKEISDIQSGRRQISEWVKEVQTSPSYFRAINRWHREWLGLRAFLPTSGGDKKFLNQFAKDGTRLGELGDPRSGFDMRFGGLFVTGIFGRSFQVDLVPKVPSISEKLPILMGHQLMGLESTPFLFGKQTAAQAIQEFDPRTAMVVWETKTFGDDDTHWKPRAAWLIQAFFDADKTLFSTSIPGLFPLLDKCAIPTQLSAVSSDRVTVKDVAIDVKSFNGNGLLPDYYLCSTTGDSFLTTPYNTGNYISQHTELGCMQSGNNTGCVATDGTKKPVIRFRRFAPPQIVSGSLVEQSGVSKIHLWLSGQEVYVSNVLTRYLYSCYNRPLGGVVGPSAGGDGWPFLPADMAINNNNTVANDGAIAPYVHNRFSCGAPVESEITKADINEALAYPIGFNPSRSVYHLASNSPHNCVPGQTPQCAPLNSVQIVGRLITAEESPGKGPSLSSPSEGGAILRLDEQLENEPYHLLEYILKNNRPYTDLVTAPYTIGGPELELFYRTQGYFLPLYPQGVSDQLRHSILNHHYSFDKETDQFRGSVYPIEFRSFSNIPANFLQGRQGSAFWPNNRNLQVSPMILPSYMAAHSGQPYNRFIPLAPQFRIQENGMIPPKNSSGILTMPAFLGPVSGSGISSVKMRTISSRIFSRLLCGEPSSIQLSDGEKSIHEKYMADPSNSAANRTVKEHLNQRSICYSCHLNIDPLSQAIAPNFLKNVQEVETLASVGEFFPIAYLNNNPTTPFLGVRTGTTTGKGAFLGKEVSGMKEVGEVLASSPEFSKCVANVAFKNLFGRSPLPADLAMIEQISSQFQKSNYDFNRLIELMVESAAFSKEN